MNELDVFEKLDEIADISHIPVLIDESDPHAQLLAQHREWLKSIRHERPNTAHPFKVAIYIRYFNQTKYEDYLTYHKKQFADSISLCPMWEMVGFYIDEGSTAPNMETAPEWSRLLCDCMDGKVDLIITQKISNVSKKAHEVTLCARLLAAQPHPIGIYFVSEDIFTLASYYQSDLKDSAFFPSPEWAVLPDDSEATRYLND